VPFKFNPIQGSLDLVNAASLGDVVGPASATDNAIARFDTTTGKLIQNSGILIDDLNNVTGINELNTAAKVEVGDPGLETAGIDIAGTVYATKLRVNDIGGTQPAQQVIHRHSTTLPAALIGARANSDTSAHANVANNQVLFRIVPAGYAGTNYKAFGYIDFLASTGTISDTSAPSRMEFYTVPNGSLAPTLAMTIGSNQVVAFANSPTGVNHLSLSNIGTNTHAQIDTHIADTSIHTPFSITSAINGQTLRYDSGISKWINNSTIKNTGTVAIDSTAAITNQPYSFLIDHAATNLVVNPSWEVNITDGWSATGTSTNTRDTTEKWIGTASLKIVSSVIDSGVVSSAISVTPNTQYVYSCYVKGAVGGERFYISIDPNVSATVDSNNQGVLAALTILDSVNTDWSRLTLAWTSGASDTSVQLYLRSDTATAQTVYVDAVQFEAKILPTDANEVVIASSYLDGSMGVGYTWNGVAHNSTSTRTAGAKFLAPLSSTANRGNLVVRTDGTIARFLADAKEIQSADIGIARVEPNFPFTFTGNMKTNVNSSGILAGIMNIRNTANGTALHVDSAATTAEGFIISAASITSGSCMSVFAPSDLTAMAAANGRFFTFSGKAQNADMYSWYVDRMTIGQLGFAYDKNINVFGGGSMTTTARALAGTVSVTAANVTVTGTGTAFLTDFKRGQAIRINNGGATTIIHTIASIASNTSLTLTAAWSGVTNAARTYDSFTAQYRPPTIHLEGSYANHGASGSTSGDFMYGIYASGGNGQLHVFKSAARGVAVTPTADHVGNGLVTARQVSTTDGLIFGTTTETTMISGYTVPAYELTPGGSFRISFIGTMVIDNSVRTLTWRVKLGGTTILTSTAVQAGAAGTIIFRGVIDIYALTNTTQRCSLSIVGKDQAAVTPGLTYSVNNYSGVGAVDMRLDQALTVTAQVDAIGQVINVTGYTTEIL
jgi:hypothetical protein